MRKRGNIAVLLCLVLLLCFPLLSSFKNRLSAHIAYADSQKAAEAPASDGSKKPDYTLFSELSGITAITLKTPERSFEFRHDSSGAVCVNGRLADHDIYKKLVSQLTLLPVSAHPAFEAGSAQLLLTLEITAGSGKHIARFYTDGAAGEEARIISGSADAPQYHQTDGWRVGTLMMTCEGTRIQDERGNELPAALIH